MTSRLRWAAVLAVAIAGCTGKTGPAGTSTGTISGTVGNSAGPIAGASVEIQPGFFTTTTDAAGRYAASVPVGVYTVAASAVGYASDFAGPVSVIAGGTVDASFLLTEETGGPVSVTAGADRYQAGFGTQVQLTAAGGPAGANLTYHWTQVPGPGPQLAPSELVGADTATLTFTTRTLQQLEDGGLYPIRRSPGALAFSEADVARASYEFEVRVTDGVTTDTDRVLVRSVVGQPGLTVVSVDTLIPLGAEDAASYAWTCTRQEGNAEIPCEDGVLTGAGLRNPTFRAKPLQEGLYTFTTGAQTFQLRAASYIGARAVPNVVTCATGGCHDNRQAAWAETSHAKYLERAIDKGEIPGYRQECIRCHTTGYDPEANNGGFADVARRVSWVFPGNVAGMPDELKALQSVGCENCHGPGSLHKTASRADADAIAAAKASIGKSYAAVDCAQCHATEPYENQGLQWVNSRHARFTSGFEPAASDPSLRGFCASCHSSQGFVTWARSGFNNVTPVGADVTEPQTCSACHDPHGEAVDASGTPTPRMLRIYGDVVTSVKDMGAKGVGPAALCMTCHNSRTSVIAATETTADGPPTQAAPHTPSQADVLLAKNAALLGGPAYPSSSHTGVPKLCVGCHMAPTPPLGNEAHNLVGGHTFSMGNGAGIFNLGACTGCHPGLTTYDRTAYGDYDGNGFIEGVRTEVFSLVDKVGAKLNEQAAALWPAETGGPAPTVVSFHGRIRILKHFDDLTSDPLCNPASPGEYPETCFAFPAGGIPQATTDQANFVGAAWNWFLTKNERSNGIHNTAFSVSVLQRSYRVLNGGVPLENATPR